MKFEEAHGNSATIATPVLEHDFYDWHERHRAKCLECERNNHDLVFIGDSITHLFEGDPAVPGRGERVWARYYGQRRALNLGFGWDRTQNVLWRLAHGEFAGQRPRLVVILIGTNNLTRFLGNGIASNDNLCINTTTPLFYTPFTKEFHNASIYLF